MATLMSQDKDKENKKNDDESVCDSTRNRTEQL